MQTGGAPPTYQDKLNDEMKSKWQWEYNKLYNKLNDPLLAGYNYSEAEKAEMKKKLGALRGKIGIPEGEQGMWSEGVKSDDWTFASGDQPGAQSGIQRHGQGNIAGQGDWAEFLGQGDKVTDYGPGTGETFEDAEKRLKRRKLNPLSRLHQQDTSTIYTGEGDDLNPELEGGKFNKESMTDPDSGLSKGIGAVAGLTGTYFDKLAGEDYAAREKKRDEAVADVDPVTGQSNLYLENKRAMAWKKGQTDLVEGYDYAGHGAKSGFAKGAGMGAQVGGPMGALVGGALGAIGGGLMGKSQGEDAKFELAADTAKKRKALQGMQADEVSLIDPTKDEYGSVAAITVKKGGKVKMQNRGTPPSRKIPDTNVSSITEHGVSDGIPYKEESMLRNPNYISPLVVDIAGAELYQHITKEKKKKLAAERNLLGKIFNKDWMKPAEWKRTVEDNKRREDYRRIKDWTGTKRKFSRDETGKADIEYESGTWRHGSHPAPPSELHIEGLSFPDLTNTDVVERKMIKTNPGIFMERYLDTKIDAASHPKSNLRIEGKVKKQAGGLIKGPGTGTSDDIPGNLNRGDFVATAKNKNKALALRKQFGLPMQKANLQKGGKTMKKIPVKVSNGETLFTKSEINSMVKKGGRQVIDYLNSLAPEAEVPLQKGGTVQKDNSQELANKYGGKKEDWYYGRYTGDDPLVKKKIEANELENEIKKLDISRAKEIAKTSKNIMGSDYTDKYVREGMKIKELRKKLTSVKEDVKKATKASRMDIQKERLDASRKNISNEIDKTKKQIDETTDYKEIKKLGERIEELSNKEDKLRLLNSRVTSSISSSIQSQPDKVKTQIDDIIGADEVSKQTSDFELPFNILGTDFETKPLKPGQAVLKIPPKVSDKDDKKQKVKTTGTTTTTTSAKTTTPAVTTTKEPKELEVGLYTDEEGNVFEKGRTGKWRWKSNKAIEEGVPEYGKLPIDLDEEWQEGDIEVDESVLTPYTPPLPVEEKGEEDPGPPKKEPVEAEREFPWSDLAGALQAGMGYKGLAAMGQRPKGVKSADLAAQKARIDAAQSQFNIPIDETLRDIERTRIVSTMPTTGERGYEQAKRSAATGQAMSNIQKTREQKAILEGQAAERFNLAKLGMQGQMASALAGEDRRLFQDDMQAFQQKQGAYAQLLQAGIANFIKGKEARATRRAMTEIEGNNNTYNFNV